MKPTHYLNFIVICVFMTINLSAQLTGVYTINGTIPVSATNFTSFTAFAAAANTSLIVGPVTVNVAPAIYTEQVNFNQATGISATNTITINGNGATLIFNTTTAGAPHTLLLSGADYMFFHNLTISCTNTSNALVVHLWNKADNNYFRNCTIVADISTTAANTICWSLSGSATVYSSATADGGANNTVDGCTLIGGYWGYVIYGLSTNPFTPGNKLINSNVRDQAFFGVYVKSAPNMIVKNNTLENVSRTVGGTINRQAIYYGLDCTSMLIDGNRIRNPYFGFPTINPAINGGFTGIVGFSNGALAPGSENVISNNLISNIGNTLGSIIGIDVRSTLGPAGYTNIYHNTVSIDDFTATATALSTGILITSGAQCKVKNNIVTISRGGNGTKKCYDYGSVIGTGFQTNYNVARITSVGGVNYAVSAVGANHASFVALNNAAPYLLFDINSKDTDPIYTNTVALNYLPTSLVVNDMCVPVGVLTDINGVIRSTVSPDPGAYETYTTLCSGPPLVNAVTAPSGVLCPNTNISLGLGSFTSTGYSIQWQSSPGLVGPYTAITGATLPFYNTNTITTTAFYNALIYCVGFGNTITATSGSVQIAGPTINNVPYYEDFEGISKTNALPNCSWIASNPYFSTLTYTTVGSNNRIPYSGSKFAAFYSSPTGTNTFYSNGLNLVAGVTYSAGFYYINEQVGYNNWADLRILVGTSQSTTGLVSIASTSASVVSYALLSGTFTIPASGVYYIAVRATTGSGNSPYLTWDDLFVNIPCSLNSLTVTLNTSGSSTICQGQQMTLTSGGANTYTWNTGSNLPAINVTPSVSTQYTVIGTSSLTGCSNTLTQFITVKPSPAVFVNASNTVICEGESTIITAQGAPSYSWSTGATSQVITVSPTITTIYSVTGTNSYTCSNTANTAITVNTRPPVYAGASQTLICKGEALTLIAGGAASYTWSSASVYTLTATNKLHIIAQASEAYTLTGIDVNGCIASAFILVTVDECSGISEFRKKQDDISVYPNPTNREFFISSKESDIKAIEITDIFGKILYSDTINGNSNVNISDMANGVYSVKITRGENVVKYIKVVKNQ